MSNPQQPELARSRKTPAQDQDAVAGVVEGQRQPGSSGDSGPVPVDNQPGHHPAQEQDKPNLDAFASRLGIPDETGKVPEPPVDDQTVPAPDASSRAMKIGAGVLALIVALLVLRRVRRRRGASGR